MLADLVTPALLLDAGVFERNLATMAEALPGPRLRPHVKAHKCTALARRQLEAGHRGFTCATVREVEGMAAAGLGEDLLLANEVLDARRLGAVVAAGARLTVAVDSEQTVRAAAAGGVAEVVIDVGGELVTAGGTGTYSIDTVATEIQAGSYALMDTQYAALGLPFRSALSILGTVISVAPPSSPIRPPWAVCDVGLKAHGMDHGNPSVPGATVWLVSDEHTTFAPEEAGSVRVGDRVRVLPAHVDPTVALHDRIHLVDGAEVVETWPVDLRGW